MRMYFDGTTTSSQFPLSTTEDRLHTQISANEDIHQAITITDQIDIGDQLNTDRIKVSLTPGNQ